MPNPFDFQGPQFLLFYFVFAAVTVGLVWHLRRRQEADVSRRTLLNDYLQIAYLRGGHNEALRVATMNLVNRGLVEVVDEDSLRTAGAAARATTSKSSEQRILEKFRTPGKAATIFADPELREAADVDCRAGLTSLGLLPGEEHQTVRAFFMIAAIVVLGVVAGAKIVVALSRGRSNILFLVLEVIVFCVLAYKVTHPFRTPAGDALLDELRTLFAALRDRAGSLQLGASGQDVALLAAVFGTGALPSAFSADRLFRRGQQNASSCGAGCGSTSGGSSCGGGSGCGGGGGCGGCGS